MTNCKKPRLPIKPKNNADCQICGRLCHYKYYGVWSCESCKQFFRRVVLKCEIFKCPFNGDCEIFRGANCRGCRFDKCLLAGMKPELVHSLEDGQKSFMEILKSYQEKLMGNQMGGVKPELSSDSSDFCALLNPLIPIERAYHRIWDSPNTLCQNFANRHQTLRELVKDGGNLLGNSAEYLVSSNICWDKAAFIDELDTKGAFSFNYMNQTMVKDWFLSVEMAKAMHFFKKLDLEDQIHQLKHIFFPICSLFGAFYAHAISAKTVTRGNGFTPISFLETTRFCGDEKIRAVCDYCMLEMVERMGLAGIEYQEFLLLFALLIASSTAEHLSEKGRELLYAESVSYSKALLKMLHIKFGTLLGSEKFASLLKLIDLAFAAKYQFGAIMAYIEVFYEKRDPRPYSPKAIRELVFEDN